jgi:hypothetical protein
MRKVLKSIIKSENGEFTLFLTEENGVMLLVRRETQ